MSNPKVHIETHLPGFGRFTKGDMSWDMSSIFEAADSIEAYELQLSAIDLSVNPWNIDDIDSLLYHMKRINTLDDSYPIIQDPKGFIIDGWHRVVKAIMRGDRVIKAKRLKIMPKAN